MSAGVARPAEPDWRQTTADVVVAGGSAGIIGALDRGPDRQRGREARRPGGACPGKVDDVVRFRGDDARLDLTDLIR